MTRKLKYNHGSIRYVSCKMSFFDLFSCVTLCQLYSFTSPLLFTKNSKLRKEDFLYIWLLQRHHVISKEVENCIFRHNRIFRHSCMHKQPISTKQWNCNIFMQISHRYVRHTDRLLDVHFLLLAVILSELYEKQRRKD